MTLTTFLLWVPVAHHVLPDDQAAKAAKYDWGFLSNNDPFNPDGSVNYTPYVTLSDRLRGLNPAHKTGWFCGGVAAQRPIDPAWPWLREDFLLHYPDGRPLQAELPGKMINLASRTVQYDLADHYVAFLREKHWSGIMFDSYAPNEWASWVHQLSPSGCREGTGPLTVGWWEEALGTSTETLRYVLGENGMTVIVNGIAPGEMYGALGTARVNAADAASGMLYEMGHRAKANPPYLQSMLDAATAVIAKRREVHWFVQPRCASLTGDPAPDERNGGLTDHHFHLGTYLLVHEPPYTHYGLHPYSPYSAWDDAPEPLRLYVHWSDDWTAIRDLGPPLGTYRRISEGVWVRDFARGFVVVNPTNGFGEYHWAGVGRLWDRFTGRVIDTRSGGLLMVDPYQSWLIWTG